MADASDESSQSSSEEEVVEQKVEETKPEKKKRAPKKKREGPKKPMSSYMFFCQDRRPGVMEENPGVKFGEMGKMLGAEWKKTTAAERKKYEKQALDDKERYTAEGGMPTKRAKKKKATGPKKPMNAFFFFSQELRPQLKESTDLDFGGLGREIGRRWKECPDKGPYTAKADADKARYQRELTETPAEEAEEEEEEEKVKPAAPVPEANDGSDDAADDDAEDDDEEDEA